MTLDFRNTNALWCSVAAETLHRGGLRHAVISPGSRNTPLTMALVAHPGIECTPVLDERSAAFFGLGIAKRTGEPVLLLCTSGSAGAHSLPALIEARESGAPLVAVTADRPPELRDCASGQTIDQQKLFGGFVAFYHELAVPEPRLDLLKYLRQTLRQALRRARTEGPVHLNAPFRDPLPPIPDASAEALACAVDWETFFDLPEPAAPEPAAWGGGLGADFVARRGVVVAGGGGGRDHDAAAIGSFAAALGWPLLADALSPARFGGAGGEGAGGGATVIAAYDAILRDARAAEALRPEAVIVFGELPTSKVLRAWLAETDAPTVQFSAFAGARDGTHGRTLQLRLGREEPGLSLPSGAGADPAGCAGWARAEVAAQAVFGRMAGENAFEGAAVRLLSRALRAGETLCVASSMPVRDLEYFAPARADGPRVLANRGANGIDGTLSTALGAAQGGGPTVLLTGDLALLHDTNGFLLAPRLRGSLTVVVVNNAGGGIFGHLPVAAFNPPFEEYWATPQRVDFGRLCSAYSVEHHAVAGAAELAAKLREVVGVPGLRVLELRTDRIKDAATRKRWLAEAARAAGDAVATT